MKSKDYYSEIIRNAQLKVTDIYDEPLELLSVGHTVIFTLGNLSVSTGKAKSKKTFNVSAIVAAVMKQGRVLNYSATDVGRLKILYIDTEQSKYHSYQVLLRILKLAGRVTTIDSDDLIFLALREYGPIDRRMIIEECLQRVDGVGLLIIDGIRDLMFDINDPKESMELVNTLMVWSTQYNIHIHVVLHQNKNDEQLRGHVGTELCNKAETVLHIAKNVNDSDVSSVRAMHVRGKEFPSFSFRVNDDGLPELMDGEVIYEKKQKMTYQTLSMEDHKKALQFGMGNDIVKGYDNVIGRLREGYSSIGFSRGRNTLVKLCSYLVENQLLIKVDGGYKYDDNS